MTEPLISYHECVKRLALLLLTLAAISCSAGGPKVTLNSSAPAAAPPSGWKVLESPDKTVSMAVPSDWSMWTSSSEFQEMLNKEISNVGLGTPGTTTPQDIAADNPAVKGIADQMDAEAKKEAEEELKKWEADGIMILAKNSARMIPGESPTHVKITRKPGGGTNMEQALELAAESMKGDPQKKIIDLPVGKAAQALTKYDERSGDSVTEAVYILFDGNDTYRARFVTVNTGIPFHKMSEEMMQTFRVKAKP
jgi:hypothetical protein